MADVICFGEALVDFVSLESGVSLIEASGFQKAAGGAPANVSAGLARLGVSSRFVGKVGEDPFGHFLEQTLHSVGVDTSGILYDPTARTGLAFVSLTKSGERDFVFYRNPSADMLISPDEIQESIFENARIFHYGSISLISEPGRSATLYAKELAHRKGLILSCDPNLRLNLWKSENDARFGLMTALEGAEIVKISSDELEFLYTDSKQGINTLLDSGARIIFVTYGSGGCAFYTPDTTGMVPAFHIQAIDTTGAGDAFVAGALSKILGLDQTSILLESLSENLLHEIAVYANAVGALTCRKKGAIPAMPDKQQVCEFLKTRSTK